MPLSVPAWRDHGVGDAVRLQLVSRGACLHVRRQLGTEVGAPNRPCMVQLGDAGITISTTKLTRCSTGEQTVSCLLHDYRVAV
jgi:hypothetical protein